MMLYCTDDVILFRLPEDCMYTEEPQIARWDYKKKSWRMDGFSDFNYDEGRSYV